MKSWEYPIRQVFRTIMAKLKVNSKSKGDLIFTIASRFVMAGCAAVSAILVARVMGKEALGLFGLLRTVPAVLMILTEMGVSVASPYLINYRKIEPQRVLSNALFAGLAVGALNMMLWCAALPAISKYLLRGLTPGWILAVGAIPLLGALEMDLQNVLRAMQRYRSANLMRIGLEAGLVIALTGAHLSGRLGVEALVLCVIGAHVGVLLFGVLRALSINLVPVPAFHWSLLRESASFGIRSQLGVAINLLNFRLDHLILSAISDLGTVGVYVVATKTAEIFRFLPQAIAYVMEPRFALKSRPEAVSTVRRVLVTSIVVNAGVMGLGCLIGPWLMPLLFSEWSLEAVTPFYILMVGLACLGGHGVLASFNLGQGQPQLTTWAVSVGLVVTVALDFTLIPRWGATGAAVASALAYAAIAGVLMTFFFNKECLKSND